MFYQISFHIQLFLSSMFLLKIKLLIISLSPIYLFESVGISVIYGDCDVQNVSSWRLLERLGFQRISKSDKTYSLYIFIYSFQHLFKNGTQIMSFRYSNVLSHTISYAIISFIYVPPKNQVKMEK